MAIFFSPSGPAFYDDAIPTSVPDDAIKVTESERDALLNAINSGGSFEVVGGKPRPVAYSGPDLMEIRIALKRQVDVDAETERLKYITPGNGQTMTYQQKVTEAQAFKVAASPVEADYPILSSEVGITAETLGEVADIVLAAFAQWQQIGAAIESIRLGAKRDIDAAQDEAAVRAVVNAIVWPHPAL
ncbi:hypothetical protein [Ochrobactrum chromiisoli]|uniref:DUF4376 domain-containing protein n=1 Tax=Ochrobactrum chromiisoli TaxID=2993941 RepID=A0ABT3QL92_9HYPH|nr:hypothetical protein [Ochrobactrum chromiisoli]MCX2696397.1 hypothetical protein [Ochrobactrum chromiisoli]